MLHYVGKAKFRYALLGLAILCILNGHISYAANFEAYKDIIHENQQIVVKQTPSYKPLLEENQEKVSRLEPEHRRVIKQAEQAIREHASNTEAKEENVLEEIIANIKNLEVAEKKSKYQGIIIFASFSMPQNLLWNYQEQAKLYGARIVIRGLVDNDFKKTVQAMGLGGGKIMTLDINPILFKDYGIENVPSIVIAGDAASNKPEDKFIGPVSIKYALEESSTNGDQKEFSLAKLKQLSEGEK